MKSYQTLWHYEPPNLEGRDTFCISSCKCMFPRRDQNVNTYKAKWKSLHLWKPLPSGPSDELQNPGSSGYVSHHPPCGFKLADLFWRRRLFDKSGRRFVIFFVNLFIFLFIFLATLPIHLRLEPCRSLPDSSVQNLPHLASLFWGYLRTIPSSEVFRTVSGARSYSENLSLEINGSVLLAPIQDAHNPQSRKFSSLMHVSCGSKTTRLRSNMIQPLKNKPDGCTSETPLQHWTLDKPW